MKDGKVCRRNGGVNLLQLCKAAFNCTNRLMIRHYLSIHLEEQHLVKRAEISV